MYEHDNSGSLPTNFWCPHSGFVVNLRPHTNGAVPVATDCSWRLSSPHRTYQVSSPCWGNTFRRWEMTPPRWQQLVEALLETDLQAWSISFYRKPSKGSLLHRELSLGHLALGWLLRSSSPHHATDLLKAKQQRRSGSNNHPERLKILTEIFQQRDHTSHRTNWPKNKKKRNVSAKKKIKRERRRKRVVQRKRVLSDLLMGRINCNYVSINADWNILPDQVVVNQVA